MVHSPALSPDCNKRGSPLTRTQPSRRSIFNSISACQHAWGAGQRMEEGEAALSQVGKVAAKADITREGAYKALREGSKPRFETILKMLDALGMQFAIVPKATPDAG